MLDQYTQTMVDYAASKVGCGYIYGATGWVCSLSRRQQQATQYPEYADKILGIGAKWDGKQCFDCAQLVRLAVGAGGGSLPSGATSQWNKTSAWLGRGSIDTMPDGPCILYRQSGDRMQHTGVYIGDGWIVDARGTAEGVVKTKLSSYAWTHWALPVLGKSSTGGVPMEIKYRAQVVGGALNMRGEATPTGTRILQIPSGGTVDVLDVYAPEGWLFVSYGGKTGYVMAQYLVDVESVPDAQPEVVTVPADEVHTLRQHAAAVVQMCDLWIGGRN